MVSQVQDERFDSRPHLTNGIFAGVGNCLGQRASDLLSDDFKSLGKEIFLITKIEVKGARGTPRLPHDTGYSRGVVIVLAQQTDGWAPAMAPGYSTLGIIWRIHRMETSITPIKFHKPTGTWPDFAVTVP